MKVHKLDHETCFPEAGGELDLLVLGPQGRVKAGGAAMFCRKIPPKGTTWYMWKQLVPQGDAFQSAAGVILGGYASESALKGHAHTYSDTVHVEGGRIGLPGRSECHLDEKDCKGNDGALQWRSPSSEKHHLKCYFRGPPLPADSPQGRVQMWRGERGVEPRWAEPTGMRFLSWK